MGAINNALFPSTISAIIPKTAEISNNTAKFLKIFSFAFPLLKKIYDKPNKKAKEYS